MGARVVRAPHGRRRRVDRRTGPGAEHADHERPVSVARVAGAAGPVRGLRRMATRSGARWCVGRAGGPLAGTADRGRATGAPGRRARWCRPLLRRKGRALHGSRRAGDGGAAAGRRRAGDTVHGAGRGVGRGVVAVGRPDRRGHRHGHRRPVAPGTVRSGRFLRQHRAVARGSGRRADVPGAARPGSRDVPGRLHAPGPAVRPDRPRGSPGPGLLRPAFGRAQPVRAPR